MSEGERANDRPELRVPSGLSTMVAIAAVAWKRLLRGRALWIGAVLAFMPLTYAIGMRAAEVERGLRPNLFIFEQLVMSVLAAMFMASAVGEEIEDRTTTYLWSRPVPRWAVLVGKLAALAPIPGVLICASWYVGLKLGMRLTPPPQSFVALFAGGVAVSMIAAGVAVLVPRHGMALTVVYMLFDAAMSNLPASIQNLTVSYNVRAIAQVPSINEGTASSGALWLAVVGFVWLGVGLWRIRRLEA